MGLDLLSYLKNKVPKEQKLAFAATFFLTLLIHMYHFTNTLPNHDSILNYYTDQNILGSGRWALSLACGLSSYFDLPWVIGIVSCIFIALTAAAVVAVLKITNPVLILLTGGLLGASPAVTETFFFLFTADGYMIAMFLAALAVYFSRMEEKRSSRHILSAACICVSCGIYQAYVSFALILAVCYFLQELFLDRHSRESCFRWIFRQVCIFISALAAYYIIWKLLMHFTGTVANDYQGISEVGKISLSLLTGGILRAVKSFVWYFLQWNVFKFGFTPFIVLNLLFLLAFLAALVLAFWKSGIFRRTWATVLVILCLLAIIPFACMWHFTSDSVVYRAMMLQSLMLLFVLTGVLFETWANKPGKNAVALLLLTVTLNHALMANIGYFYLNQCYERTYAEGLTMAQEIWELQQEYDFDKVAVIGTRYPDVQQQAIDPYTGEVTPIGQIQIFSELMDETLLFDSGRVLNFLKHSFGLEMESLPRLERKLLFETDAVQAMPCWPEKDSICVIDNILIIKLSGDVPY